MMHNNMTSKRITSLLSGFALIGVIFSSALPASAEQAPNKNGPGVARVSVVQGSVVVQRGDSNKQVAAVVNAPLIPGDYVSTSGTARGELQFDGTTAVRLGGNVQARITNDDPHNRQLQLADGTIVVGLLRDAGQVQVDTPSVTVRTTRAGDYRVSIGRDGSTWVTTRRGEAEIVTPQQTYTLDSGRTLVAHGSASDPSVTYATEVGYDSFDDFSAKRDQTMVAALNASPNLNPDIAGYDNLGAYGQWHDVAGYGQAWVPDQGSNWSPYGSGSWTWEGGYGWTWVGNEPWGWAPYHYGNWTYANGYGWAWVPPAYNAYPAWSPALVGFFGFGLNFGGPGWGVSLGVGDSGYGYGNPGYGYGYPGFAYPYIGWYPVPPYTAFYPWWPGWAWNGYGWGWGGGCCGWGTRVVNVTRITNIYRYFPHGGIHGVRVGDFRHGTISGRTFIVNRERVGNRVGMIHGAVPVTPGRENLGFGGRSISAPVSFSRTFDSPRFASANRAFAGRASFDEQQRAVSRAIEGSFHNNAPVSRESSGARGTFGARGNAPVSRENLRGNVPADSWQRFNQTRGNEIRGGEIRASEPRVSGPRVSGPSTGGRDGFAAQGSRIERAPSDSWGRFSQARGNVPVSYGDRAAPARGVTYGTSPYERNNSYSRQSYPSYTRESYPSYSRGSYGSYPSYARGGGYSAPRTYGGGYSAPRTYGGGYSAPRSNGGGYSAPRPSRGNGGGGSRDRGRPPH
jgi:hypothetical protein